MTVFEFYRVNEDMFARALTEAFVAGVIATGNKLSEEHQKSLYDHYRGLLRQTKSDYCDIVQ